MAVLEKCAGAAQPGHGTPRAARSFSRQARTAGAGRGGAPQALAFLREYFPQLAAGPEALHVMGGTVHLLAPGIFPPGTPLRVVRAGVPVGRQEKGRFEPAHALFMAYGAQCTNREELTLADPRTAAWLRGEEIDAATAQNGWCAVLVDGFPLGGGKVSGGRIKNHYPKGLRNLQ